MNVSDDEPGPSTPKKKREVRGELPKSEKTWRNQTFRDSWLTEPDFKGWLCKTDNINKARCKACNKELVAGKSELLRHSSSKSHKSNASQIKNVASINTLFSNRPTVIPKHDEQVKKSELRYVFDVVEHNRSFNSMDHFVQMNQSALPDSKIVKDLTLKRTKITCIVKYVINKAIEIKTADIMKDKHFSVLIDESTDCANCKNLCILVRFIENNMLVTYLLNYVKIKDATAENLFKVFKFCLSTHGLSVNNIIGYCSDNANVMMGDNNSFMSRLLNKNPNIFVIGCICHSFHLIASKACDALPKNVEAFLHLIYSYFSRSPKRQGILDDLQELMRQSKQKMINPSETRWLALGQCVGRVLKQWNVLFSLFSEAKLEDNSQLADTIFQEFNSLLTKAFLEFLNFVLPLFNSFCTLFQSNRILIASLGIECERFLRLLAANFMKPEVIRGDGLFKFNPKHPSNLLPYNEIKIGAAAENTVKEMKDASSSDFQIQEFYLKCIKFYQIAFEETIKRLPLQKQELSSLIFLQPSIALGTAERSHVKLNSIIKKFETKVDPIKAADEWDTIPNYFSDQEKKDLTKLELIDFWKKMSEYENFNGELIFREISTVALICLALPHSNADVERIFSMVSDIKTRKRNRLKASTVAALVRIKLDMRNSNKVCSDYPVTDTMLKLFNDSMYRQHSKSVPPEILSILAPEVEEEDGDCF